MAQQEEFVSLQAMSKTRYFKKLVMFKTMVTGKAILPYQVPREILISCDMKAKCKKCHVKNHYNDATGVCSIKFTADDPNLLQFVNIQDTHFHSIIRRIYNIDIACQFKMTVKSVFTLDEIYMTDLIQERSDKDASVMRIGYVVNQVLEANTSYILQGYVVPEPKTQRVVVVVTDARLLKTDVDTFHMTPEVLSEMNRFQEDLSDEEETEKNNPDSVTYIHKFLDNLYSIYASNITQIYQRFDLHMAIDLVFHSPLQFYFNNEFVHKGWLDVMIIGDTRCGKGYVSENLIRYYGFGDIVSGENLSFAGLVGGVQQVNGRWIITWGKIPLNHKRLVVVDEASEMDPRDFSRLSRIRSEGVAEISKIHSEKTHAMTRLIFLTNPKNRMISSYSFGIEALSDLIENAEDISRFDYVMVVAQNEVDINEINKERKKVVNPYKDIDPLLIQWIWSRKPEQIMFEQHSTDLILRNAIELGHEYSPKIPLIQGENIRIKLAKISAAIAGRLFSHDRTGQYLVVKPIHVRAARFFINVLYKKSINGYFNYSQIQKESELVKDEKTLVAYINSFENKMDMMDYFVNNNRVNLGDLSDALNQPPDVAREILSKLIHHKCIRKGYNTYYKNPCFSEWLRDNR
jgi:MCM P-loop domain